jgi:Protein of unknown function (DUF3768)
VLDIADKTARIRELNDAFRSTLRGGRVMLTSGFNALPDMVKSQMIERIKTFTEFDPGNDPYQEHDFVSLEIGGPQRSHVHHSGHDHHARPRILIATIPAQATHNYWEKGSDFTERLDGRSRQRPSHWRPQRTAPCKFSPQAHLQSWERQLWISWSPRTRACGLGTPLAEY